MTESRGERNEPVAIGEESVPPGERRLVELPVARLPPTETFLSIPVEVLNGARHGPSLWLSAALHGDELNGIEIIRRVLAEIEPGELHGRLLAVPIVNVFGLIGSSRYLPDRRDLNRCFPGARRGTLAARIAHIFMNRVVSLCSHGIDFHTGSNHRTNLPQIRCNLRDAETRRCAMAFGAPVIIHAQTRDGSLRQAATALGRHVLLFEGGETLRFENDVIDAGVEGTFRVMRKLKMIKRSIIKGGRALVATKTTWVRARSSGLCRLRIESGDRVKKSQVLGSIADVFGAVSTRIRAPEDGLVVGLNRNPLVHRGDGLVHLAVEFEERERSKG